MIELIWEAGCPHIETARARIRQALAAAGRPLVWGEWDREDPHTPDNRAGYGSPSILVDGVDVAGAPPAGASCCRVYRAPDGEFVGAPTVELVQQALTSNTDAAWSGFPRIETERLLITIPPPSAAQNALRYFDGNRAHLAPWDPARPEGFYTRAFWQERLDWQRQEFLFDQSACFFGQLRGESDFIGIANLRNFVRGSFQACHLGYSIAAEYEGQGLMSEMVGAVVDFAFDELRLHRVMANYLPENVRSAALLERLGFEREGLARAYLNIAGQWRDHVLTSKISE